VPDERSVRTIAMIDREWVSIIDPGSPHDRYVFDVSFLLSAYTCIYGAGCRGTADQPSEVLGCCRLGAHYVDSDDRERIEAMVDVLGPAFMQHHAAARRRGVTATVAGEAKTRVKDGACIFLNRGNWPAGPGCALHQYALARGEHHMTHKPEVCWIVPLRRTVEEGVADDGEPQWTTTITSYDRGAWGPGGADFAWWCTTDADGPDAYVGRLPVYRSMEHELRAMAGDGVYDELARYLEDRRASARTPLPFPVFIR
jgi:hypothetical protein